jgi:hypothetical protein
VSLIANALPQIQTISEGEMLDAVTVHTAGAVSQDTYGGKVVAAGSDVTTVGRISPLDANDLEQIVEGERRQPGLMRLTLPRATTITADATVTVVSARHGTTRTYSVESVLPLSTFGVDRKVIVKEKT